MSLFIMNMSISWSLGSMATLISGRSCVVTEGLWVVVVVEEEDGE